MFISLDQYTNSHKVNQEWLDEILDTTSIKHIFAAGHEPAFQIYKSDNLGIHPEDRDLFWESLTSAGAHAYFSGHAHFYDHSRIDDYDGDTCNDLHQVIVGTGGAYMHPDADYDGDNGRWTPQRLQHSKETGYVLVELEGDTAKMTWKRRTGSGVFEKGGDSYSFHCTMPIIDGIDWNKNSLDNDQLFQNYPNPFITTTTISYELSVSSLVEINIYDIFGRKVSTVLKKYQDSGTHKVTLSDESSGPGIYICELKTRQGIKIINLIKIE